MSITLTVGTNTYISLTDADTYFNERLNSDVWNNSSESDRKRALIMSTKRINKNIFIGVKQDSSQALEFPRYVESYTYNSGLPTSNISVDTPEEIEDATCEEAITLLSFGGSKHVSNQKQGIKSMSMGSESISYDGKAKDNKLLSQEASELVEKWTQKGFNFGVY